MGAHGAGPIGNLFEMLKLISLLALETGAKDPHAEIHIRAAAKHPGLTVEQFVCGCGTPTGYAGWFYLRGQHATPEQLTRICGGMGCSPSTPLNDILEAA